MKVLIIEDEKQIAEAIEGLLVRNGFTCDICRDGETGLDFALGGLYDIIVLDLMLPGLSGREILKTMRDENNETPVIVLTAKSDSCAGYLDLGADDYIQKPYRSDELVSRIRAVIRRRSGISDVVNPSFGDITVSVSDLKLVCEGASVSLTRKEAYLMEYLIANRNLVLSKEQIIRKLWGYDSDAEANHVEVYISFLRKKLKFLKSRTVIETVRGVGYSLVNEYKKE